MLILKLSLLHTTKRVRPHLPTELKLESTTRKEWCMCVYVSVCVRWVSVWMYMCQLTELVIVSNTLRNHQGLLEESETGEEHGYHLWLHRSSLLRGA